MPEFLHVGEKEFPALFQLICALADFEKLDRPDDAARERLQRDICGQNPRLMAYLITENGQNVGYSLLFETYSSFLALPTLYLEDIFILPEYRGRGIGHIIMQKLARLALQRGCGRMEWVVLDWNKGARDFYDSLGARQMQEWLPYRLDAAALAHLAGDSEQ
jgi:GNAT superfamily N-acetyltransferase